MGAAEVNMRIDVLEENQMPAMPPNIGTCYFDRFIKKCLKKNRVREGMKYYDHSKCVLYDVNVVPLKPTVNPDHDPVLHADLAAKMDSLKNLYPKELIQKNIGSNVVLFEILKDHLSELDACRPRRYSIILADINIFHRTLKVSMSFYY